MSDSNEDTNYEGVDTDNSELTLEELHALKLEQDQVEDKFFEDNFTNIHPEESKVVLGDMWGSPPASSVRSTQTYQDIFGIDPYNAAKSLVGEDISIYDAYYKTDYTTSTQEKADLFVKRVAGVSDFFGTTVYKNAEHLQSLGIYNRTIDQSRNIIPKSNFETKRLGSKIPEGFRSRAVDVDYANWFEGNLSRGDVKGFKGSFYQFGESNVVHSIMSSNKPVEITSQTYQPINTTDSKDKFFTNQRESVGIYIGSQVTKAVFARDINKNKTLHSAEIEDGAFHPKLGYFYGDQDNVVSAVFGTQNITTALSKNNTIEEVLFLTNKKGSAEAGKVLTEIKTVADILQSASILHKRDKSNSLRSLVDSEVAKNPAEYVTVNQQVTRKAVDILGSLQKGQKAIVSIQYLENLFSAESDNDTEFTQHRTTALENLKKLLLTDQVAIAMSDISFGRDQGLFSLIDKMKAKEGQTLYGVEELARSVFQLAEQKQAFRSINTQFMHSKSIAVLGENNELVSYFISSANWGKQSFNKNIETGLHLTGAELLNDLGINAQHISNYNIGIWNTRSTGLYVEQKGVESRVNQTVGQLDSILSEAKREGLDAPFRYNKRYINDSGKFKAVGFDIVLQDKMTLSVTIGESKIGTYNRITGKTEISSTPIVYLNKGNRVITGAMWTNKSSSLITLPDGRTVETGQTIDLNAIDILQGILYTLHHSSKVEREQRVLLQSLERLNNTSDTALAKAVRKYFSGDSKYSQFTEQAKQAFVAEKLQFLQKIINTKDYRQVLAHNPLIRELIRTNQAAEAYYNRDLRQSKSTLLASLIDIFAKPHELSYSYTQKLYDKASYGISDTNLNMLLHGRDRNSNNINLVAPLLGQIASEHNELTYINGMPAIRGVGATNRLESTNPAELMGGLGKAEGGTLTVKDLNIMNSIPGLMLLSAKEYRSKISKSMQSEIQRGQIESFVNLVFSEAASRLKEGEKVKDEEVILYFPYPKPEQISQRLKNLMSVRPFVGSSTSFTSYVKSFGFNKYDKEDVVGSKVATALPAVQYEVYKEQYQKNRAELIKNLGRGGLSIRRMNVNIDEQAWTMTEKQMQKRSLDLDDMMHGFVESPKLFFLNMGGSSMSDYSDINMTLANKTGYVFTHRTQQAIDLNDLGLSPVEFQSILQSKLKEGTMFVPLKTRIKKDTIETQGLYRFLETRWNTALDNAITLLTVDGQLPPTEIDILRKAQQDLKHLAKTNPEQYDFALAFEFTRNGVFDPHLKKGVYNPVYDDSGKFKSLERIGDIPEGSSAYLIYGLTKSQKAGTATKASGYFDWTNPSQGRRLAGGISVLARAPQISIVDRQPSMITLNTEYYTWQGLSTGMRTTTIKGPMRGMERGFFQAVQIMHSKEHKEDLDAKSYITQEELFGISSPGQMKGFVFSTGYALLRDGKESAFYKQANNGKRIVEALSLMMLSNKVGDETIKDKLLSFYQNDDTITNRTQFKAMLSSMEVENKLSFTDKNNLGKQVSSIAMYEGFIGLIDEAYLKDGEEGLVKTIAEALTDKTKRDKLASRAQDLFTQFFSDDEYTFEKGGNRTFNEQKGRSAALLAFYMKAADSLLGDVDPARFNKKSISEIGYVSKKQAKETVLNTIQPVYDEASWNPYATKLNSQLSRMQLIASTSNNIYKDLTAWRVSLGNNIEASVDTLLNTLLNKTPGAVSSYEGYLNRPRDREMYRAYAQSMAVQLPRIEDINKSSGDILKNLLEQLELGLHQMYSVAQATRFMPIYVDPKVNKNAPAVGMQNKTDLEGHYAQRLTELQLKMYTKSATDYKAVDSVASVVIRLAGIVEADHGILNQTTLNSKYKLQDTHLVTMGAYQDRSIRGLGKAQSEAASVHALRFSLDFARAYSNISSKVPVNLLGGRTTINDKTKTVYGEVQASPAFAVIRSFLKTTSKHIWNSNDFDNHLGYMTHVTALARRASSDYSGDNELVERRNAMLDDYMHFISSPDSSLGKQARDLVQTMLQPLESLAKTLSGNKFKGTLLYDDVTKELHYFEQISIPRKVHQFNIANQIDIDLIEANPNHVYNIDLDKRRGLYQELLVKRFIGERVNKSKVEAFLKDTSGVIGQKEVRDLITLLYTEAPAAEKALLQSIIGKKIDDVIQANLQIDPGKEFVQGRQALRDYSKAIVRSHGYTYSNKDIEIALGRDYKSGDAILTSSDAKKVYNYYKNLSSKTKSQKALVDSFHEVYMAHKVMSNVSYTQSISIPYLELQPEATSDGTALAFILPNEHTKAEKGILLGLDITERVSLVFPQYSSAALEAQQSFAEALSIANQQGLLTKINDAVTNNKELRLTQAEYTTYQEVLATARQSRETSAAIAENEKITRNAMGEQLPMKGASYIAMSSFLVSSTEVAFGEERMGNILKLQEGGFSKILKGYTDIIYKHAWGDKFVTQAAVDALNQFASFFNEGHTPVDNVSKLLDTLGDQIYKDAGKKKLSKQTLEKALRKFILGSQEMEDKEVEKQLYLSHFLKGRQGAPSGTGYDFASGAQGIYLDTIHGRGKLNLSSSLIDVENGSTAMLLSAMGNEFTQLGDYDGDSFQAAINRMAEATAEVKQRQEDYSRAITANESLAKSRGVQKGSLEYESVIAEIAMSSSNFIEASKILAEKTQALDELHRQATTQGKENIRKYAQAFMGLPGFVLDSEDGRPDRLGVISDEEIAPLVKQYRDTISGWYDNQKAVKGYLSEFLATKVETIDFTGKKVTYKADIVPTEQDDKIRDEILGLIESHKAINAGTLTTLDDKTQIEKKQEIIQTAAILSQANISTNQLFKLTQKQMGSQMSMTNFAQIQAIVGATGTGLLGKTYNSIIPLLSISAGNSAMLHTLENNKIQLIGDLSDAIAAKRATGNLSPAEARFLQTLNDQYVEPSAANPKYKFYSKESISKAQAKSNAMFGLLMNVQQFLRDAALKGEKGSKDASRKDILDMASEFHIEADTELAYLSKEKGLANLLNAAKSTQHKSMVMEQFIVRKAGFSLDKLSEQQHQEYDTTTLKAFSALQLVNEYMSGSYSADEMFEYSAFKAYLNELRGSNSTKSNVEIVEGVIKTSLSNFRSQFIYNSVLEGKDRVAQLTQPTEKLLQSFDIDLATGKETGKNAIKDRVWEYQREAIKSFGVDRYSQLSPEQRATIKKEVKEYKEEQYKQKQIILDAVQGDGEKTIDYSTKIQNVWKAIIGINIDKQMEYMVGKDGQPGIISQVRDFNIAVQQVRDGVLTGAADTVSAEMGTLTYSASLGRAKIEPLTVAQAGHHILQAALSVSGDKDNIKAVTSLMAGMGFSTQNLDFIQKSIEQTVEITMSQSGFTAGSKEYLAEKEKTAAELHQKAIELLIQPFKSRERTTSFAEQLATANTATASIANLSQTANDTRAYATLHPNDPLAESMAANAQDRLETAQAEGIQAHGKRIKEAGFDPINQGIDPIIRQAYSKEISKVRSDYVKEHIIASKKSHRISGLIALLAIPTLFSIVQGDITFNDRVADLFSNVSQAALSTVSYKESSMYKTLYSDVKLNTERTSAEKAASKVNSNLQYARIAESLRRNSSITEGLIKSVAFEAIYSSASIVAAEVSNRVFGHNTAANIASEVGGALLGMALANTMTDRNVPGSFGTYDYAYDITMRMIKRVKDNILAAGSALTTQLISGSDVSDDLQVYTSNSNESLSQTVNVADASLNNDLNNMPLAVSLEYRDGNGVGEQLVQDVLYQGDLESGDILISVEDYDA